MREPGKGDEERTRAEEGPRGATLGVACLFLLLFLLL